MKAIYLRKVYSTVQVVVAGV